MSDLPPTARATLCCDVDDRDEVSALKAWMQRWKGQLSYVSPNHGCGCCVHLFDVEGPPDAIACIPASLQCGSEWVTHGRRSRGEMGPPLDALAPDEPDEPGR